MEILTMEGYEVDMAGDGLSGLLKLVEFRPDLILCDMSMPHMDGATFIVRARKLGMPFRLVIMTAWDTAREVAASVGADYVSKPIDLAKLFQVVTDAMKRPASAQPI